MPVVGDASVVVRAITNQVRSDIRRALQDARPDIKAEGLAAGREYGDAFGKGIGNNIQNSLRNAFDNGGVTKAAGDAGRDSGRAFNDQVKGQLALFDLEGEGRRMGRDLGDGMASGIGDAGDDIGGEVERTLGGAGGRGGRAFRSALDGEFARAAQSASQKLTVLIGTGNLIGAAVGTLVSSLSAAASGLFAMGAAASQAAGGLAVIPGAALVAAQGLGTLKLAFSGVGDAVKAGFAPVTPSLAKSGSAARSAADGIRSATQSVQDAIRAVADAQENLSRVQVDSAQRAKDAREQLVKAYRDAAESAADAADKVSEAEGRVLDAERDLLSVQRDLNRARAEAAEQLQQLAFDAEGAALAEQRAGLRLKDAHAKLVEAQSLPPDDRARQEAELSYKEAELAFRQAKDRNADLAKEQANAAKAGVEGSKTVLDARQKISDAENKVLDAEKNLAEARKDQARDQRDSAEAIAEAQQKVAQVQLQNSRSIRDAQKGVADAQNRLARANEQLAAAQQRAADATTAGAKAADKYKAALAQLSPAAQTFVKYLVSLKDEFKALKAAAGAELFPGLQAGLEPIVRNIFPILQTQLRDTGGALGLMAKQFGTTIATGEGLANIKTILQSNNETLDIFTAKGKNGQSAIENLAIVFTRLGVAIQPITQRFAQWLAQLSGTAEAATRGEAGMNRMTGFLERAGDTAAQLGRIFKNLFTAIFGLGKAAQTSGHDLLDSFEQATKKLSDLIALPSSQTGLQDFFANAGENLKAIGRLVNAIGLEFLKLGDNQGVKGFADSLIPAVTNIGKIGDALTNAGPEIGAFATQLSELFVNLTQGDGLQKFIANLTAVLKVVNDLLGSGFAQWVLGIAASVAAFTRVAALVLIPLRFLFKALIGGPIGVIKGFQNMLGVFGRIPKALGALRSGQGISGAFAAMKKGSKDAEKAFQEQMVVDKQKITTLKLLEEQADRTAAALQRTKKAGLPGKSNAAGAAAGAAASTAAAGAGAVVPNAGAAATKAAAGATKATGPIKALSGIFGTLGKSVGLVAKGLLSFLGGPIGIALTVLPILITVFKNLYQNNEGFRKFIDNLVDKFKEALDWIQENVFPVFAAIGKFIAVEFVAKVVPILNVLWGAFKSTFSLIVDVVKLAFDGIKLVVTTVLLPIINNVIIPIIKVLWEGFKLYLGLVKAYWEGLIAGMKLVWDKILAPLFNAVILPILKVFWMAAKGAFDIIKLNWAIMVAAIKLVWNKILAPLFTVIVKAFDAVKNALSAAFKWIGDRWNDFQAGFSLVWTKYISPVIDKIKDKFEGFKNKVKDVVDKAGGFWTGFKDAITGIYDKYIAPLIDKIKSKFEEIKTKVSDVVTGATKIFDTLKNAPANGIKALITAINTHLLGNINKMGKVFGFHIDDIPIPQFAEGGLVRGRGGPKDDKILARLSNKEFVVNAAATKANLPTLLAMNKGKSPLGVLPIGGWNPFADVKDGVSGFLGDGLGKAMEKLIRPFADKFVPQDTFAGNFFHKILDKMIAVAKAWGDKKESTFVPEGNMIGGGRSGAYGGVKPWVAAAGDLIRKMFGVNDIGGVGGRPNKSDHPMGYALDFMVYKNKALGDRIAAYMLQFHQALKVTYLIWYKRIVSGKNGWKWRPYTHPNGPTSNPTLNHMDHVHASFAHSAGKALPLATGGVARATPGGIFAQIAEAGRDERVEPLDREGFSKRDRALVTLLQDLLSQRAGGDTYQVFPSPGMNEVELAEKVSRRVAFKRKTGT